MTPDLTVLGCTFAKWFVTDKYLLLSGASGHMQKSAVTSKVMVLKGYTILCLPLLLNRGSVI